MKTSSYHISLLLNLYRTEFFSTKMRNHPITMAKEKKKSSYNTRGSQFATKRINTNKYQNNCLQLALRIDGYKDKYTNPRRTEATTDEYLVEIQTIKNTRDKRPKRLQETNIKRAIPLAETSNTVKCEQCGLTFKMFY
jgi:hypothetical protein